MVRPKTTAAISLAQESLTQVDNCFLFLVCVLPYKGYSLKVRDSGWRLASRAEALAQRRELCHVLHLHGANRCDLADGNVFLVKEDPADGRMGRVGESSTAKMEWVAVAKDLRRGFNNTQSSVPSLGSFSLVFGCRKGLK